MDNVSVITIFYLSGLTEPKNNRFILFSLSLVCYFVILLVNLTLIVTIILDKNLHEPMYILLCAFCMNGLYGSTGFFPKFLWDLLSPVHVISYSGCLVQALSTVLVCPQWSLHSCSNGIWQICGYMSTTAVSLCHVKAKTHKVSVFLLVNTFLHYRCEYLSNIKIEVMQPVYCQTLLCELDYCCTCLFPSWNSG